MRILFNFRNWLLNCLKGECGLKIPFINTFIFAPPPPPRLTESCLSLDVYSVYFSHSIHFHSFWYFRLPVSAPSLSIVARRQSSRKRQFKLQILFFWSVSPLDSFNLPLTRQNYLRFILNHSLILDNKSRHPHSAGSAVKLNEIITRDSLLIQSTTVSPRRRPRMACAVARFTCC